jgi:hypothetical protein
MLQRPEEAVCSARRKPSPAYPVDARFLGGSRLIRACAAGLCWLFACLGLPAVADSKLLATSGGLMFEGQAGGGIVPWALIAGYGDEGEFGGAFALTQVRVDDFELLTVGGAVGIGNRFELGAAQQRLRVQPLNLTIRQDIVSAKVRAFGDAVYGSLPAVTAGVQFKHNRDAAIPYLLGADDDEGVDLVISAGKLWLDGFAGRNVFGNLTLRNTNANQTGFLGFGSDRDDREWVAEGSLGVFLSRRWVVGVEYRQKPDNLGPVEEDPWLDAFVGWFPNKRVSVIGAWADLGAIAGLPDQTGFYVSLQLTR